MWGKQVSTSLHLTGVSRMFDSDLLYLAHFSVLGLQPSGLRKCLPLRQRTGLLTVYCKPANSPSFRFFVWGTTAVVPLSIGPICMAPWRTDVPLTLHFLLSKWIQKSYVFYDFHKLWQVKMLARKLGKYLEPLTAVSSMASTQLEKPSISKAW